jgi:hypothetical protein
VTTFAGTLDFTNGYTYFHGPWDANGNVYVGDSGNNRIQKRIEIVSMLK